MDSRTFTIQLLGVERHHIIDGQQRLTTLQYVLTALIHALRSAKNEKLLPLIEACLSNSNHETMKTHEPGAGEAEQHPAASPNFFAEFDAPLSLNEVADLAVRTLAQVFDVAHPDQLEYGAFDTKGGQISFPA